MRIRKAILDDVHILTRFNSEMALETENLELDQDVLGAGIKTVIEDPGHGYYLLLELEDKVRASLLITYEWSDWRNGQFWWIQSVYVEPEFRRQGLFKKLYSKIKTEAENDPACAGLRLYVEKNNARAQQTYLDLGMQQTHYQMFEYPKSRSLYS